MQDAALTPEATSRLTGFAVQTLANWRSTGKGPAWFRVHRNVRYMESKVAAWLAEQESQL